MSLANDTPFLIRKWYACLHFQVFLSLFLNFHCIVIVAIALFGQC
jgi:hypothetical protein